MSTQPASILARYPELYQPLSAPVSLRNSGGLSGARLWRLATSAGQVVARCWPEGSSKSRIETIHRRLADARGLPFIPVPLPARDGTTLQTDCDGLLWELAPLLEGRPDQGAIVRVVRLEAAFISLGLFHERLAYLETTGPSPGIETRVREIETSPATDFDRLRPIVLDSPADELRDRALRWIDLARQARPTILQYVRPWLDKETRLQPCLRDARREHFLFQGDQLSGLVDFGAMDQESIAADLARLLADWLDPSDSVNRDAALRAYRSVRPLDPDQIALIDAFETGADLLIGGHWLISGVVEKTSTTDRTTAPARLKYGVLRLERRMHMITRL